MVYIWNAVKNIFLLLDGLIITINGYLFQIFFGLTGVTFENSEIFNSLANRLYVLIGIFMVFRVTFSLIQMLANPDLMTDKEKGMGKLATRIVIALVMLVLTPFVFEKAIQLQQIVINENIISKIVLGIDEENLDIKTQGETIAMAVFKGFVSPNEAAEHDENYAICNGVQDESGAYSGGNIEGTTMSYMRFGEDSKVDCFTDLDSNKETYYSYLFGASTIGGIILAWMVVGFCIDIGVRLIKLGFYQIIAPIPIISYVNGDKNGPFNNWVKRCASTYISVFVKLLTIYFVIYICSVITNSGGLNMDSFDGASFGVEGLAMVAIILGLVVFAKTLPNLINDMFGIKPDNDEKGFVKNLAKAGLLGAAGLVAGGANRIGANARNFGNVFRDKNASLADKIRAGAGILTGGVGGALSGAFRAGSGGYKNGFAAVKDIGKNTQRMNELANRRFARQAAFRASNPASVGFLNRLNSRVDSVIDSASDSISSFTGGGSRAQRQDRVMQNLKNIFSLRDQMKKQADFFTGGGGVGNVKDLKQKYEDLMHSGTATQAQITSARKAYEAEQEKAITYLASQSDSEVYSLAQEMQRNVIEGQNSSYSQYFDGMSDVANGIFTNDSTKKAFIDASRNQIKFENSIDYKNAHSQQNNNNNNH